MWKLYCDVTWTRRKTMHHVLDETNTPRWSGKDVGSALEFVRDEGQQLLRVYGAERVWLVSILEQIE